MLLYRFSIVIIKVSRFPFIDSGILRYTSISSQFRTHVLVKVFSFKYSIFMDDSQSRSNIRDHLVNEVVLLFNLSLLRHLMSFIISCLFVNLHQLTFIRNRHSCCFIYY